MGSGGVVMLCLALCAPLAAFDRLTLPRGPFPIAEPAFGSTRFDRSQVKVAAGSGHFLVVWQEYSSIRGVLLDRDGRPLQRGGLSIATSATLLAVATDGHDYLIAWTRNLGLGFTRVTGEGNVLLCDDPGLPAGEVSLAWIGEAYAMLFAAPTASHIQEGAKPKVARIAVLDRGGRLTRPPREIVNSTFGVYALAVASGGSRSMLLLAWADAADHRLRVHVLRTDDLTRGAVRPVVGPSIADPVQRQSASRPPSIATNGESYFIIWQSELAMVFRILDAGGSPLTEPEVLSYARDPLAEVVWDGTHYVVPFMADYGRGQVSVELRRIAPDGREQPGRMTIVDQAGTSTFALASSDGDIVFAWSRRFIPAYYDEVYGDLLRRDGSFAYGPTFGGLVLSEERVDRVSASVVWRSDHYLAAWQETTTVPHVMYGRFHPDGRPMDGRGIALNNGSSVHFGASGPEVATDGADAVVSWTDDRGKHASFIDANGTARTWQLDGSGNPTAAPFVVWNGTEYLVSWFSYGDFVSGPEGRQYFLLGVRIARNGDLLDSHPVRIIPTSNPVGLAWTGAEFVVLEGGFNCHLYPCRASMRFFSAALAPLTGRIDITQTATGLPLVAQGSPAFLVVWPEGEALRGARVLNRSVIDTDGFTIGEATGPVAVTAAPDGWEVTDGPYSWLVKQSGETSSRSIPYPFVPAGSESAVVLGGPAPLVVYAGDLIGGRRRQILAQYVLPPLRQRGIRR